MDALNNSIRLDQDYTRLKSYQVRNAILIRYLILTLIGLVGMLVAIVIGVWRWRHVMTHFGPAVLWRWLHPFLWAAIGLGLLGGLGLFLLIYTGQQEIQLSPMGITWRKGRNLRIFRWDEIEEIYINSIQYGILSFVWANQTEVVLRLQNGKRLRISQAFEPIESLVSTLKCYVYPHMLERFQKAFHQGQAMRFGPITLTLEGVLNGRKALQWQDIRNIQLQKGRLDLHPIEGIRETGFSFPAHKIPNIDLCIQFLHHYGPHS